jgi:hypothetical protein
VLGGGDLVVVDRAVPDEPGVPRRGGVVAERVEDPAADRRTDGVQQRPAGVARLGGHPAGGQDPPGERDEDGVARVVDGQHRVGAGGDDQVAGAQRTVAVLPGAQLGERQALDLAEPRGLAVPGRALRRAARDPQDGAEVVVGHDGRVAHPRGADERRPRVQAGVADDGDPDEPGRGRRGGDLRRADRQVVEVVADGLGDDPVRAGQQPVQVRQVVGLELVDRRHPDGRDLVRRRVEDPAQRLGLAVAEDQHERSRPVRGRLQTVEAGVVPASAVIVGRVQGRGTLRERPTRPGGSGAPR